MADKWKSPGLPFELNVPIGMWLDKSAPPGRQRRIGGLLTTDSLDRQGETVVQKGLDFAPFLKHGWFNDNHSRDTDAVVGYPDKDSLRFVKKGESLPDGRAAPANGHWAEGYLLDTDRSNRLWGLGQALAKSGDDRRLGFSIEGGVQRRLGEDRKIVAKAVVNNVAITNCPVNTDAYMQTLAKSLTAVEQSTSAEDLWKALTMGEGSTTAPTGPVTGEGAGAILSPESLEDEERVKRKKKKKMVKAAAKDDDNEDMEDDEDEENDDEDSDDEDSDDDENDDAGDGDDDEDEDDDQKKSLTPARALELARARFPGITTQQVGRLVRVTRLLKERNRSLGR